MRRFLSRIPRPLRPLLRLGLVLGGAWLLLRTCPAISTSSDDNVPLTTIGIAAALAGLWTFLTLRKRLSR